MNPKQRDWGVILEILTKLEEKGDLSIPYRPETLKSHNANLLIEGGFVREEEDLNSIFLVGITWKGYELLDKLRSARQ